MTRDRRIANFLESHGYGSAHAEPLPGDAGLRRYVRLSPGPRPALLMDAAPPEDVRPFVRIASHLAAAGICVPEIYAVEPECGLLLEEDLGDRLLAGLIDSSAGDLEPAFDTAIDVLARIHQTEPPRELPRWDAGTMARTALATVFDWWWPAMFGAPAPDAARDEVAIALDTMLAPVAGGPACFVHRDYFAGNLLWLPQRTGLRRIAVIDFQGAAIGHPAYDLASLLQDSRRDIPAAIAERAFARYLAARGELDPVAFRAAYDACAAQRHLRIAGQWVRLAQRDDRPHYLRHGPHTWALLDRALGQPVAAPLAAALDHWIPANNRCNPPGLTA